MVVCPDCGWPNYSWWFWPYVTQNILAIIFVSLQKLHVILHLKRLSSKKQKKQTKTKQYTVTSLQRTGILILKPVHNQVTVWPSGSCTFSQRPDRGGIRKTITYVWVHVPMSQVKIGSNIDITEHRMTCQMNKYPGFAGLCIGLESCSKHK